MIGRPMMDGQMMDVKVDGVMTKREIQSHAVRDVRGGYHGVFHRPVTYDGEYLVESIGAEPEIITLRVKVVAS